ncbi:N-6 DNA methylase [Streptomyces sp. NPDC005303]|uniref:N-6 DNA methylase n=1 Tax=Streptomyces sp. NPDC005303 TaxID=3155713 RepID=UPI0033A0901F
MSDIGDVLVSRSDIARLAGVRRPAVTNWERRHPDFPVPVVPPAGSGEPEVFRAAQILDWLSGRTIPSNALQPGEPAGTTYGDRFRAGLGGAPAGRLRAAVERLAWRDAERVRGQLRMSDYLRLLLELVHVQSCQDERWSRYVEDPRIALRELGVPEHGEQPLSDVIRFLDNNPPASPDESRATFDRLLELFCAVDGRGSEEFFTPRSVSRVMGRALAAQGLAKRLHDPFCRTGELLSAYLDAVGAHHGEPPPSVSGRSPREDFLGLARMNTELHGAKRPSFLLGRLSPAQYGDQGDLPGACDVVITNPPFGSGGAWRDAPPVYWRYGTSRSLEFDWLQYVVSRLAPDGRAAVLMPSGAGSRGGAEQKLRADLIEAGVVECVMALPAQLFELTTIQTHIWFLRPPREGPGEVLFVDGTNLGSMATRTRRVLSDEEIDGLVGAYASWRAAEKHGTGYADGPGLTRVVAAAEIAVRDHRLEPTLYVRDDLPAPGALDAPDIARDLLAKLSARLRELQEEARAADGRAERSLRRYGL